MPLTAVNIASLPPVCSGPQLQSAFNVLTDIQDRLKGFPPQIATLIVDRTFTRSEWEMYVKAVRWFDRNEALRDLPLNLVDWVRKCALSKIETVGDDGDEVPDAP